MTRWQVTLLEPNDDSGIEDPVTRTMEIEGEDDLPIESLVEAVMAEARRLLAALQQLDRRWMQDSQDRRVEAIIQMNTKY